MHFFIILLSSSISWKKNVRVFIVFYANLVKKHSYKNQIRDIKRTIKKCQGDEEKVKQLETKLHELEIAVNDKLKAHF